MTKSWYSLHVNPQKIEAQRTAITSPMWDDNHMRESHHDIYNFSHTNLERVCNAYGHPHLVTVTTSMICFFDYNDGRLSIGNRHRRTWRALSGGAAGTCTRMHSVLPTTPTQKDNTTSPRAYIPIIILLCVAVVIIIIFIIHTQ